MKLFRYLALAFAFTASCLAAELPDYYQTVNRVTWVVQNIDKTAPAWEKLGMTDIQKSPNIQLKGEYHGKPVTIYAWQVTGHIGNITVDMIQPAEGQLNAFNDFLGKHGDGIFSIVHAVPSKEAMEKEIARMKSLGVNVIQQVTVEREGKPVTFTYFSTEPEGKYTLGLVYWPGGAPAPEKGTVTHLGIVTPDGPATSDYWKKLGFPGFDIEHASPRPDMTYRGKQLLFHFDVGFERFGPFALEWLVPPPTPPNAYEEFWRLHHGGVQHFGMLVDDLDAAVAKYKAQGFEVWQHGAWGDIGKKDSGVYDYMDTNAIGGVSMELIHAY
jgi:catechol 2,3-dioxygenase-like lactoylglutathione lyase family enzyme